MERPVRGALKLLMLMSIIAFYYGASLLMEIDSDPSVGVLMPLHIFSAFGLLGGTWSLLKPGVFSQGDMTALFMNEKAKAAHKKSMEEQERIIPYLKYYLTNTFGVIFASCFLLILAVTYLP